MEFKKTGDKLVIRISRGENIINSLKKFCVGQNIQGGFFFGLGAVDAVEIAHYDVSAKKYTSKKFDSSFEMTNISGDVGYANDELIVHAHATFADQEMQVIGGHLVEATVSGTVEIIFFPTEKLNKKYDKDTGLKIFNLNRIVQKKKKD
ncbi:MAG: DNA-binding protein [Patescibacteria group bacterium]|nr:DNA-binding protein [Patescibacteria group bacterium]